MKIYNQIKCNWCLLNIDSTSCVLSFTGFSSAVVTFVSTTINMYNFPKHHRGLIVGTCGAAMWIGAAIIAEIFNRFYNISPVGDIFMLIGILMLIIYSLSSKLVRRLPSEDVDERHSLTQKTIQPEESKQTESAAERYGINMLCVVDYQMILWGFTLAVSIQLTIVSNVTVMGDSYGFTDYNGLLTVAGPLLTCVTKIFMGWISDRTKHCCPRMTYVLFMTILQTVVNFASIFAGNQLQLFMCEIFVTFMAIGTIFAVVPTVVSEYFGMRHFSRDYGLMLLTGALFSLITSELFGVFYEAQSQLDNSNDCFLRCFQYFYGLSAFLSGVSSISFLILYNRRRKLA